MYESAFMSIRGANIAGIIALLFWSANIAITRHVAEAHPFGLPALSLTLSGIILIAMDAVRKTPMPWQSKASWKYWLLAGSAFVLYVIFFTTGLSAASSRSVALALGLVNYFWPSLILLFMPFFFQVIVRWGILAAGMLFCIVGVGCSLLWGITAEEIVRIATANWAAFLMMAASAVLWAFYSNAARKWGEDANGVGWFQLGTAAGFFLLWMAVGGPLGLTREMIGPFLTHSLIVSATSYMLWDISVRYGDIGLLGTLANFLPIASVVFGVWYLGDSASTGLWIGAALVTLGAVLCRKGVKSKE